MSIIGTAGHVDHGKSTLVAALTGRDPDRWAEEKRRGLTIDLGFAWTELAPDLVVGFVDVPGHERFIKNMLAGVGALDVAMFVVAADEGWMPQSEEHLAVLDLLEVRHGVIALSRVDLVDEETQLLAELEIAERVAGTVMEDWPVVPVSPITGSGLRDLTAAIAAAVRSAGPSADSGRPCLWVDRSFTIAGAGAVVTGTMTGGTLTRGQEITLFPGVTPLRVRNLQVHEHDVETIGPGTRAAVNVTGGGLGTIVRGSMLGNATQFRTTLRVLAELRTVRTLEAPLTGRGAYHLHVGSGSWPVEVRVVGSAAIDGTGVVLIDLPAAVPLVMGDRYILREAGRRAVVGGGQILDPHPARKVDPAAIPRLRRGLEASPDERAELLLELRGQGTLVDLATDSGGGAVTGLVAGDTAIADWKVAELQVDLHESVARYQEENPLRPGAPKAELTGSIGVPGAVLDALAADADDLLDDGATIRTVDFSGGWGPAQEAEWSAARQTLIDAGLAVPRASQLGLGAETFHSLLREGKLVRIDDDLVYLPEQIDVITGHLSGLQDGFTVADFRDALAISRRQAVPLLEWLDGNGWTTRSGDVRRVRKRRNGQTPGDAPTP